MKTFVLILLVFLFSAPVYAVAQTIATPYWCGWGWSSTPCTGHSGQYGYSYAYSYPYNYSYANNYNYNYPCTPVSYDSRGVVVQTSCGYVNVSYPYQNQYWYQPHYSYPYYSQYQWNWNNAYDWSDRHDHDYRDRNHDWHH